MHIAMLVHVGAAGKLDKVTNNYVSILQGLASAFVAQSTGADDDES